MEGCVDKMSSTHDMMLRKGSAGTPRGRERSEKEQAMGRDDSHHPLRERKTVESDAGSRSKWRNHEQPKWRQSRSVVTSKPNMLPFPRLDPVWRDRRANDSPTSVLVASQPAGYWAWMRRQLPPLESSFAFFRQVSEFGKSTSRYRPHSSLPLHCRIPRNSLAH